MVPFTETGGPLAYGPQFAATVEQWAVLLAKVLSDAKPGDLPIERVTTFEFGLKLKTAKDFHLTRSGYRLLRADRLTN